MLAKPFDIAVIGTTTRDVMFYDSAGEFLLPKKKGAKTAKIAFDYGSKIPIEKTFFTFGGGGANTAVNFAHQGWRTTLIAAVGDDDAGQAIVDHLHARQVDTGWLEVHEEKMTGFSFILTAGREREHVIFLYRGANESLQCPPTRIKKMKPRWWYVAQVSTPNWTEILTTIFSRPGRKAWNPGSKQLAAGRKALMPYIGQTHLLGMNYAEAAKLVGRRAPIKQLLKTIHGWGAAVVIITKGADGADAFDGEHYYHQAAIKVGTKILDTTGVGDAFHSTFLTVYDRAGDIPSALAAAARNAAAVTMQIGAQEGLKKMI